MNRDIAYAMGFTTDDIFAGNFFDVASGLADGFDKIAAYGWVNGQFRFLIDTDNDGVLDVDANNTANINGYPVSGDFNPALPGDEVAVFAPLTRTWHLDLNGDFTTETALPGTQMVGYPITGDFDGDGLVDLGTWSDDTFRLDLSTIGGISGVVDREFHFGFIGVGDRPVAADFNMDGFDDLGLWVPERTGVSPGEGAEWFLLISDDVDGDGANDPVHDRIRTDVRLGYNVIDYRPTPFGSRARRRSWP